MAKVPAKTQTVIAAIAAVAAANATAVSTGQPRQWLNYKAAGGGGKFDFPTLVTVFSRIGVNTDYVGYAAVSSMAKDIQVTKLGGDVLAGLERDYRLRTRSRIRSIIHTAVRAKVNGLPAGPLTLSTIGFLSRIAGDSLGAPQATS